MNVINILVATDGSEGAARAVDYAAKLSKTLGGRLLIANVASGVSRSLFEHFTSEQNVWLRETESAVSAEILNQAKAHACACGAENIVLESRFGDPVESIIAVADEQEVDLIVVGKRGAGQIKGLLFGSVSQKLVSLATLPVTVVP